MSHLVDNESLVAYLSRLSDCVVAFSGGVDSAVVAKAAQIALGDKAIAVTGLSASLATGELETAQRVATQIGIHHEIINTDELSIPGYLANAPNRCWHCKTELYSQMRLLANRLGFREIANGTNLDDLGDFRPGLRVAKEQGVLSPLVECSIDKQTVRQLALEWKLEVWDKPASPCLSSRVIYGLDISPERLAKVDAAELFLKTLGFTSVRVRYHQDDLARLEVATNEISRFGNDELRTEVISRLLDLGFKYVVVDLVGFRSGSFLPVVSLNHIKL